MPLRYFIAHFFVSPQSLWHRTLRSRRHVVAQGPLRETLQGRRDSRGVQAEDYGQQATRIGYPKSENRTSGETMRGRKIHQAVIASLPARNDGLGFVVNMTCRVLWVNLNSLPEVRKIGQQSILIDHLLRAGYWAL